MIIELVWAGATGLAVVGVGALFAVGHSDHRAFRDTISAWHAQSQLGADQAREELLDAEAQLRKALDAGQPRITTGSSPAPGSCGQQPPPAPMGGIRGLRSPARIARRGR